MLSLMMFASIIGGVIVLYMLFESRMSLLVSIGLAFLMALGFRVFVAEPFINTANNMAPTLRGQHLVGICPDCGASMIGSPVDNTTQRTGLQHMICENFHISLIEEADGDVLPADRVLVSKLLAPRRWDIVVFRYPQDPSVIYMKRLIGMPGETITIADGTIFVDGEPLTPPDELAGIEYWSYWSGEQRPGDELWGHPDRPAVLGDDEYFVLGDFTARSNDSRIWEQGAAGNSPYAVPESHLYGVVTHIYWPISRWRSFR